MTIRLREEIARVRSRPDPGQVPEDARASRSRGSANGRFPADAGSGPLPASVSEAQETITVTPLEVTDPGSPRTGDRPGGFRPPTDGQSPPRAGLSAMAPDLRVGSAVTAGPRAQETVPGPAPVSLGPLDASVADPRVGDILVVGPDRVFAEVDGTLTRIPVAFGSEDAVLALAQRIAAPLGRELTVAHPFMDARLDALGLRVTATIPPFSRKPTLSIRKTRSIGATAEDLLTSGFATEEALEFLAWAVRDRQNLVIAGPTGAGKTTLARYLARHVPPYERIITVEETYELGLSELHPHVVELETRTGPYAIDMDLALRQVLHMRPDRIIVGEVRHKEALQLLVAMGTGHRGSWTTLHSDRSEDVFDRLVFAMRLGAPDMPMDALFRYAVRTVNLVVYVGRTSAAVHGRAKAQRKVGEAVRRLEGIFEVRGLDAAGQVVLCPADLGTHARHTSGEDLSHHLEGGLRP